MSNETTRPDMGQDSTDPSITNPAPKPEGPCIIAEVEAIEREVDKAMPRVQRAAYTRELKAALRRAAWAAEKLGELGPEEAGVASPELEEEPEGDDDGPVTDPMRPHRSLALLSDGSIALSMAFVEGGDIEGYEQWIGVILKDEEAAEALDRLEDACVEIGGHVGGHIQWRKKKGEPEGGEEGGA